MRVKDIIMFILVILSLFGAPHAFANEAPPTYFDHVCSTSNATLSTLTDLNIILSHLISNASLHDGFYRTASDTVTGLFLCRGDVTPAACQGCVAAAAKETVRLCPNKTESVVWFDACMLRYSNSTYLNNIIPSVSSVDGKNIGSAYGDQFKETLASMLNEIAGEAANSLAQKKFATQERKFSASRTLFGLAQCTPELSGFDCMMCLRSAIGAIPMCCDGKQGGRVLLPGCNIRYQLYPFYNINLPTSAAVVMLPSRPGSGRGNILIIIFAIFVSIVVSLALFVMGYYYLRNKASNECGEIVEDVGTGGSYFETTDSVCYDLATIEAATNNFSDNNKIGQGGFGMVYKGTLPDGQEIAVKRLAVSSLQGAAEFRNEAALVAKLQHRNLVRLLGFCLGGPEKILVYEYIPNKSLDHYLFDAHKQRELDWTRRYSIIIGIARGVQYLHEDSQLRVVHRDLKASNVLLDSNMKPKVSDFGAAKIIHGDQTQAKTRRIVGTFGYMSPEYAMHGQFSLKSDVYSFGVLVLEIVSGKKNSEFYQSHHADDLLSYAWKSWREKIPMEFLDPTLRGSYSRNEVIRCIHIGLLCVQENPAHRPSMATVHFMLNSYSMTMPSPRMPASFLRGRLPPDR